MSYSDILSGDKSVKIKGKWNAFTNEPFLQSSKGNEGDRYYISTSGSTILNTNSDWMAGDFIIFIDGKWIKEDNTFDASELQNIIDDTAPHTDKTYSSQKTEDRISEKVAELVDSAPQTLNTLKELSNALGDDANFASNVLAQIGTKANSSVLATETQNRIDGDVLLQQNINAETSIRQTNDSTLNAQYLAEVTVRQQADDTLQNQINQKSNTNHTHTASDVTDFQTQVSANGDVSANTQAKHMHLNKALLDSYTQTESNLSDAVIKKHNHPNQSVLDGTQESFTTALKTQYDNYATLTQLSSNSSSDRDRANHTGTQTSSTISDFTTAASVAAPVQSIAGKTGTVSLVKADVGLGNVDNTADASKNVLSATKLTNARTINGVSFDGTASITPVAGYTTSTRPAANTVSVGTTIWMTDKLTLMISTGSVWINVGDPIGKVSAFSGTSTPSGWVYANGATGLNAVTSTQYADLFSYWGSAIYSGTGNTSFTLPDYRGKFLRGQSDTTTNDPDKASRTNRGDGTTGDAVGTQQSDGFISHTHIQNAHTHIQNSHLHGITVSGADDNNHTGNGSAAANSDAAQNATNNVNLATATNQNTTATNQNTGGNETRPININVRYYIKL